MKNELVQLFDNLIEGAYPLSTVRALQEGRGDKGAWSQIVDSGFLDALVPESQGGAGLSLRDVGPLIEVLGQHIVPDPVAETMVGRALLAKSGSSYPNGLIMLGFPQDRTALPNKTTMAAKYAIVADGDRVGLIGLDGYHDSPSARANRSPEEVRLLPGISAACSPDELARISAVVRSTIIAGASERILEMTTEYANARVQFGKPIGRLQAIQQQIAVMSERVAMVRIAAQIGYNCELVPSIAATAIAKSTASAAVVDIAGISHAVHGAIGVSHEHDLHLYTRTLHDCRLADGSEGLWYRQLGNLRVTFDARTSVDFIRNITAPSPAE